MKTLRRNSTNVLRLTSYTDDVTGLAVTDATVTASLYNPDGTTVTGATNISMPYVAPTGSFPAQYRGVIANSVALPLSKYGVKFHATNANGVREFTDTCIVEDG